jgi:hypothetical protein
MQALGQWLDRTPLGILALIVFGGMVLAAFVGSVIRRQRHPPTPDSGDEASGGQEGYLVSAVLGLLALLTAFTFSLAIDRFDDRRERVLVEANAIGTTYLRAQLLDEPHRSGISRLLVGYTDNRIALASAEPGDARNRLLATNDRFLVDLWKATVAAYPDIRSRGLSVPFLQTMNEVIDMDAARKAARTARVPVAVLLVLFLNQLIAAGVLGYVLTGRRGRLTAGILLFLFALSLLLIMDINNPIYGSIVETQQPMIALHDSLKVQPPEIFGGPNPPPGP